MVEEKEAETMQRYKTAKAIWQPKIFQLEKIKTFLLSLG